MVEILKADPLLHSSRDLSYLFIKSGCAEYSNFKLKHMRELLKTSMKKNSYVQLKIIQISLSTNIIYDTLSAIHVSFSK